MKKFLAIFTAISVILTISGCGNNTSSTNSEASSVVETTPENTAATDNSETTITTDETTAAVTTEEPVEEVAYVLGGELTPTMIKNSVLVEGNKVRLANVMKKLANGEEVTVGYLGGSITQGSSAGNDLCYANLTTNWLKEQFPNAKINYVNAGIGATGSFIGVHRADEHLLSKNPDLVFIDFSVNDTSDKNSLNEKTYDSLLRKIWTSSSGPAVVTIVMTQQDGTSVQDCHLGVASAYDIPMISYRNAILDVIDKGYIKWTDISDDNIHPNVPGHAVLTQMITNYLKTVIDEKDTITGDESDFSTVAFSDSYVDARLADITNTEPTSLGVFEGKADMNFGNFMGLWGAKSSSNGKFGDNSSLTFTVNAKNIGILYSKLVNRGAKADVKVDGEYVKTIDAVFENGWGNYVEFEDIISFDEAGEHTVEITPIDGEGTLALYITALALS